MPTVVLAVHKVIVAVESRDAAKSDKDTAQADTLIRVLATQRPLELAGSMGDGLGNR